MLDEILEVGLQQPKVRAQCHSVGHAPVHIALETIVVTARRVAGVENEVVRVIRYALEAGLYLGIMPGEIEDVRVDHEPMMEQVRLVTRFQAEVRLGIERQLTRQQTLAQIEPTGLVSARERRIERLGRVELIGE